VKNPAEFEPEVPAAEVTSKEMDLARMLVEQLSDPAFDVTAYKDKYAEELSKLVQSKVEGKEIVAPPAEEEPQVINLMEALQKSLDANKAKAKPPKKVAPDTAAKKDVAAAQPAKRRKTAS
jgi:DNA end-binding protein Ku